MIDSSLEVMHPLLTEDELATLAAVGQTLHREAGHIFIKQYETTDFVLLIRKGHVKVLAGKPARIVAIRHAGEIVGEMAAIRKKPRSATVEAVDAVEVLRLSATQWRQFLGDHPRAALAQLAAADRRLEQATQKLVESELAVEQRLAKALLELMESGLGTHSEEGVALRVSQQDLAAFAGASIDAIKKIIRMFKASGIVGTARQTTILLKLATLRDIANGDLTASP
jgi:CRP-like cAMP-binding protein